MDKSKYEIRRCILTDDVEERVDKKTATILVKMLHKYLICLLLVQDLEGNDNLVPAPLALLGPNVWYSVLSSLNHNLVGEGSLYI